MVAASYVHARSPVALSMGTARYTDDVSIGDLPGIKYARTVLGQYFPARPPTPSHISISDMFKLSRIKLLLCSGVPFAA